LYKYPNRTKQESQRRKLANAKRFNSPWSLLNIKKSKTKSKEKKTEKQETKILVTENVVATIVCPL
jgi:hypothetical protein